MKKFTFLLILLVCAIGFSQQEPTFSSWADNNPDGVQQRSETEIITTTSEILSGDNSRVYTQEEVLLASSIDDLLERFNSIENSAGNITSYFTVEEMQILRRHLSLQNNNDNLNMMVPTYVGSFLVNDGPPWGSNPDCLSGLEAAALLFGGVPTDYAISTNPDTVDPGTITNTAWVTTWGISGCQEEAEDYFLDLPPPGYNDPGGANTAASAYVTDNCIGSVNYVWALNGGGGGGCPPFSINGPYCDPCSDVGSGSALACGTGPNSIIQGIDVSGLAETVSVNSIEYVQDSQGTGPVSVTINLFCAPAGANPPPHAGSDTPFYTETFPVDGADDGTCMSLAMAGLPEIDASCDTMWIEILVATGRIVYTPDTICDGNPATGLYSWIVAPVCGAVDPTTFFDLGFPTLDASMSATFECVGGGGGGDEWTVHVFDLSGNFGDEVSWELRDNGANVILSGGPYNTPPYDDTQMVNTSNEPLEFYIEAMGTFNDNTPSYEVFCSGNLVASGSLVGGDEATESGLVCPGGGGGSCTAGVYTDRATFDAETAGGTMNFEDWGGGPGVISGCDAPFNSSGNSCFAPGEILDGIEVLSSDMSQPDPVAYFPGGSGFNDDDAVGSNYFVDYTVINFPNNDVNSFGLDIYGIFNGGPFDVRIFGAGGLITTESVNVAGSTPTFFGYIAGETVVSVEIEDLSTANAEFVAQVSFGECIGGGGGGTLTECDSPALPIPDNDPLGISTTITVADSNPIDNVTVDLDISHTWVGDMIVTLESPSGTVITLIDRMGYTGTGFGCSEDDLDITLDDDATDPIEDECSGSPITGSYTPQEALSAFDTEDMVGDWILTVSDNAGGDTGTINTWCLNFEYSGGGGDNDDCADAFAIACGDTLSGDTSDNTDTNGDGSPDEWFAFTSTQVGELVTVSTCDQAAYDTILTVYDSCGGAVVAMNDDGPGCSGFTSELDFVADGSSTYYIAVDGFGGQSGAFDLSVTCSTGPLNDLCENAIAVDCGESVSGTTIDATIDDAVAPTCDTGVTSPGVWYAFTDSSGLVSDVTITMCSGNGTADYDSKLSVYTGDCGAPPLTCVVGNDDTCGLQSEVSFQSDGSTTYLILVHGFGGATGDFTIDINCIPVPPPNDDIVNAIDVVDCNYTDEDVAMPAATTEGGNPVDCDISGANGVWYKFTPDTDGSMTCTIDQPAGTSAVTFYTAPDDNASEGDLVLVDYYDNQCVPGTTTTIPTVVGQWYYTFVVNTGGITDITFECDLLGVEDNQIAGFSYYPNPADETINLSALDNIDNVVLYNILGQKLIDLSVDAISTQVNVSNLSTGTYIMKVTVGDQIGTYKVLKR